jgi:hypothetical protein
MLEPTMDEISLAMEVALEQSTSPKGLLVTKCLAASLSERRMCDTAM